jgi:hypothetical protein
MLMDLKINICLVKHQIIQIKELLNKRQPITRAIVNCRRSASIKVLALINARCILIGKCFEIGN